MHNQVSSGPVRLNYAVRGPEFAVALPMRDDAAFGDLIRQLCHVWNGVGTLLMPTDGGADHVGYRAWLPMLRPDHIYVHEALNEEAAHVLAGEFPGRTSRWTPRVVESEVDPWWLLGLRSSDPRVQLLRPVTDQPGLQSLIWALWGDLDDDDVAHARRYFNVEVIDEGIERALVRAQIDRRSPLAWSARGTDHVECLNGCPQRVLFIFSEQPSTEELTQFWNVRARMQTQAGEAMVVGLPASALTQPETLAQLLEWLDRPPRGFKPDVRVSVSKEMAEDARQALSDAGLTHVDSGRFKAWALMPPGRDRPEFTLRQPLFPTKLRRGFGADALVALAEGPNPLHLPVPDALPPSVTWKGMMHVALDGIPIAFPLTDPLARACMDNAQASDGAVMVTVRATTDPLRIYVRLPPPEAQLHAHLTACGWAGRLSGAGRVASTLLGRLPDRAALDAFANPFGVVILEALVPRSRPKLAQHIAKQFSDLKAPVTVDEQRIVELLREEGLFFDLQARTLNEIASVAGRRSAELLDALEGLVKTGLLQRGRCVTCPGCRFSTYWALRELDEQLTCRLCRQRFALPAVDGDREAPIAYRLDGLTARVMDQDLLPVVLTLRHLLNMSMTPQDALWWPGLELRDDPEVADPQAEVDLLVASRGRLFAVECKRNASALSADEARRHQQLADRLNARAVFGALRGQWRSEVIELAEDDAYLLGPETLLDDYADQLEST